MAKVLCRLSAEGGNLSDILYALGIPCIVRGLHAHPHSGAVTKQFAEPNRHGWRHRFALTQNIVKMLAGDTKKSGKLMSKP